jgi:hypothetical protein
MNVEVGMRLLFAAAARVACRLFVVVALLGAGCAGSELNGRRTPGESAPLSSRGGAVAPASHPESPEVSDDSDPAAAALEAEPEPMEAEVELEGRPPWQPLEIERRPFPRRVEQWRDLVREVMAEEWEQGTLDGLASRLDEDLILAVIQQESGGNPRARSWAGAMGLMQVMDFTFALMMAGDEQLAPAIDRDAFWDERSNVRAGIRYLALAMQYHEGDVYWSLASYNAGIGNARRWRLAGLYAVPPIGGFVETAEYAPIIMRSYMRHRPDIALYVPDRMPDEHIPGAMQLLRDARRGGL